MSILDINEEYGTVLGTARKTDWELRVYEFPESMPPVEVLQIQDDIEYFITEHYDEINRAAEVGCVWEKYLKFTPIPNKYREIIERGRDLLAGYLTKRFPRHRDIGIKFYSCASGGQYIVVPTIWIKIRGLLNFSFYYSPRLCPRSHREQFKDDHREYRKSTDVIPEFTNLFSNGRFGKVLGGDGADLFRQLFDSKFIKGRIQ